MSAEVRARPFPLSSLIDVVFLLIMFFIATAQIEQESFDQRIELASATHMEKISRLPLSQFVVSIDNKGIIHPRNLEQQVQDHRKLYPQGFEILIRADRNTPLSKIEAVSTLMQRHAFNRIKISAQLEDH